MRTWISSSAFVLCLSVPGLAQVHRGMPAPLPIHLSAAFPNGHVGHNAPEGQAENTGGYPGVAVSPDGRVLLFTFHGGGGACDQSGLHVSVLRHEGLQTDAQGLPVFDASSWSVPLLIDEGAFSSTKPPFKELGPAHPMFMDQSPTMVPDPAWRQYPCPFPSDAAGNYSAASAQYETYKMLVVMADSWQIDATLPLDPLNPALVNGDRFCPDPNYTGLRGVAGRDMSPIGRRFLKVVMQNPRTSTASPVVTATDIDTSFEVLWFTNDSGTEQPLMGIEPTITMDGRLLVFQSSSNNFGTDWATHGTENSRLLYSYNADGGAAHGWSKPKSIADLHDDADVILDGVALGDRYPIAKEKLLEMDGTQFRCLPGSSANDGVAGAYEWITLDGTDLFFASRADFNNSIVLSVSMIGSSTHWRMRHIDGQLNPSRRGNGHLGAQAYNRRLMTGTGMSPGAWKWARNGTTPLPYSPALRTMSIIAGRAAEYLEVPLDAGVDPDILLALDMNEALRGGPDVDVDADGLVDHLQEEWQLDLQSTPDTAAAGALCTLFGDARFHPNPNPGGAVGQDPIVYDGAIGEYVTFQSTGAVVVPTISALDQPLESATISFWIRSGVQDSQGWRTVLVKPSAYSVMVDGVGNLLVGVWHSTSSFALAGPYAPSGPATSWRHVAVVFDGPNAKLNVWIDGVAQPDVALGGSVPHAIAGTTGLLYLGPAGTSNVLMKEFSVDQVRVARTVRTPAEIRDMALVAQPAASTVALPTWFTQALTGAGRSVANAVMPSGTVLTTGTIALGEKLFNDPYLSPVGVSCSTCHESTRDFTDGLARRTGPSTGNLMRNAPTVLDRLWSGAQFYDGRATSLEDQVRFPLHNVDEMASSDSIVLGYLTTPGAGGNPDYLTLFNTNYGAAPTINLLAESIANYERALVSKPSAADQFEAHVAGALTSYQETGRNLFFGKARCFACHSGPNFSDESFHVTISGDTTDLGRGGKTGRLRDASRFKTPALRQLSSTGPYFHDGSAATLHDVVELYRGGGVGGIHDEEIFPLDMTDYEAGALEAYLNALECLWQRL